VKVALVKELAALSGRLASLAAEVAAEENDTTTTVAPAPSAPPSSPALLSADDVAQQTGFTRRFVYDAMNAGSLRCVRVGKYKRSKPCWVEEWLIARESDDNASSHNMLLSRHESLNRRTRATRGVESNRSSQHH
jgi:hypothetical protein